jgi:hypothetical protein
VSEWRGRKRIAHPHSVAGSAFFANHRSRRSVLGFEDDDNPGRFGFMRSGRAATAQYLWLARESWELLKPQRRFEVPVATKAAANISVEKNRDPADVALDRRIKGICRGC